MADRFDLINFGKSVTTTLGGTAANVNIDANTLFVDGTNNRVGVGTNAPVNMLHVRGIASGVGESLARFTGNSTFNGIGIQSSLANSTTYSAAFIDIVNESGAVVADILADVNADGSSAVRIGTQPAGARTDRRVERLRVDANGRVTMPAQIAFNATIPYVDGATASSLWPNNGTNFVNYTSIHLNRGSHFNTTNGRFTAPVAGAYYFCAMLSASSGSGTDLNDYQISINDAPSENYSPPAVLTYPSSIWQAASLSVVLNLAVNDFVTVRRTCCNNNKPGAFRMNFTGCLIG